MPQKRAPLVHEVGRGAGAGFGLLEVGQRVEAGAGVQVAPQLDAAGGRVEAGLTVGAQHALLIAVVLDGLVCRGDLLQLLEAHAGRLEHVGEHVVDVVPRPRFGVPALAELQVDLHVGLALAHLGDLVDRGSALGAGHERDAVALAERLGGQDHIGQSRDGRGLEQVDHDDEVELVERLVQALRVGAHAGQRVGGLQPRAVDLVGLARLDGLDRLVGLRHGEAEVVQRVVVDADALVLLDGAEHIQNKLGISGHTVKTHTYNICHKMGIGSREELLDAVENALEDDAR